MATKNKIHRSPAKQHHAEKEAAENKNFLTVVAVATLVLMVLMYVLFANS